MEFKTVKNVTLPLFKLETKTPYYLRFESPMFVGKIVDDKKEPPTMANVTNVVTGELGQIIVGQILREEFARAYKDDAYVGKIFEIVKTSPEGARKYSLWNITEVEIAEDKPAAETNGAKKAK